MHLVFDYFADVSPAFIGMFGIQTHSACSPFAPKFYVIVALDVRTGEQHYALHGISY
jgi:hypothetical protein